MPVGFKDYMSVDYRPGEDDLTKYKAHKRRRGQGAGTDAEYASTHPPRKVNEKTADPIELGTHAKNVGMGYTGKHKTIKDPGSKKGKHTHVFQFTGEETQMTKDDDEVDEALNMQQRRAKARQFARMKTKIKIGKERAARRIADPERLKKRARKQARNAVLKKLMKDVPKSELSYARRQELEKRLEKPVMQVRIDRLAKKLLPKVRRDELAKKRGGVSAE